MQPRIPCDGGIARTKDERTNRLHLMPAGSDGGAADLGLTDEDLLLRGSIHGDGAHEGGLNLAE